MVYTKVIHSSSTKKNRGAPGFRCMLHDLSLVDLKGTTLNNHFFRSYFLEIITTPIENLDDQILWPRLSSQRTAVDRQRLRLSHRSQKRAYKESRKDQTFTPVKFW